MEYSKRYFLFFVLDRTYEKKLENAGGNVDPYTVEKNTYAHKSGSCKWKQRQTLEEKWRHHV